MSKIKNVEVIKNQQQQINANICNRSWSVKLKMSAESDSLSPKKGVKQQEIKRLANN